MRSALGFCLAGSLLWAHAAAAACGVDRWPVKMAADPDATLVNVTPLPATIATLQAIPPVRPLPQERRIRPVETTLYSVIGTMVAYRLSPDGSIHLVLADESGRTLAAYIPDPACTSGSRFLESIRNVRQRFLARYTPTAAFTETRVAMEVRGVGFFDFLQGQRGAAPNGLALYPVTEIDFTPTPRPKPPPAPGARRRAVRTPGGCAPPSLSLTITKPTVCSGETTTISWQASDPAASVTIEGVGAFLPSSGSRGVPVAGSTVFSGRATNACGAGHEAVTIVSIKTGPSAFLSGPGSVKQGRSASLNVTVSNVTSWTLTSSLRNSTGPSSGATSASVQYTATHRGTDTVTLVANGACGAITRTITINVTEDQPVGGLRCCDGTQSPTCFNCADKRGCCSGHGGVCGCPSTNDEEEDPPAVVPDSPPSC
jgi:hypothetical protein